MNLITVDGLQASGKTTYTEMLCEHFRTQYNPLWRGYDQKIYHLQTDEIPGGAGIRIFPWLSTIKTAQATRWHGHKTVITDEFWRPILDHDFEPDDDILKSILTGIKHERGWLPTCSFYVRISLEDLSLIHI